MRTLWITTLAAVFIGFLVDCILGDPVWFLPHPVILIGKLISFSEKLLRKIFPKTDKGELAAGAVMAFSVPVISAGIAFGILFLCFFIHPLVYLAVASFMCWQIFAARCLQKEAVKVVRCLEKDGIEAGRKQISMLVGRDTDKLTEEEVLRAAVETVAENTSDGVIAPLFFMMLAGPVGGFFYKAINTMDSMVGYKNEKYLYFGRFAAKTDDVVNFIPARLSAIGMIVSAAILGFDSKNGARIWKRDRRKHASPNSAQTESVTAGALHIRLGGPASYFGVVHEKPTLGDPDREIERADVPRSCRLMYGTTVFWLMIFGMISLGLFFICGGFSL
ncbi:MAG: cobalamin biosynthesis protein CobD [Lachnospiraceae bacterium]|nr:cobalamin biosynthesis protein CobD [Lachnospiraceae bacterium]